MLRAPATLAFLVAATGPAFGGGNGEDSKDWLELDREITNLHRSMLVSDENNLEFGADIIVSAAISDDPFYQLNGNDLTGFRLRRARLTAKGNVGETGYKISGELSGGDFSLKDAYTTWKLSESSSVRVGQYKSPLLWSGYTSSFLDPFHDVVITGGQNDDRTLGAYWGHSSGQWSMILSAQNGVDGQTDDFLLLGRVQYDVLGDTAFGKYHGAYGYSDELHISVALAGASDQAIESGTLLAAEFGLVTNGFALRGDVVSYNDDYDFVLAPLTPLDPDEILGTVLAGTTPFTTTVSYLFGDSGWEVLGRIEEFDDVLDSRRSSAGIVYYTDLGPEGRWALLVQDTGSDDETMEGTRIELSFALKSSG